MGVMMVLVIFMGLDGWMVGWLDGWLDGWWLMGKGNGPPWNIGGCCMTARLKSRDG
jgi:hypothetical protein